jgi:hypothetical protein
MKIIYKKTVAYNLDLDSIDRDFNIIIDREYIVMGMYISNRNNSLYYLTDQDNWPNWYPSQLFEVKDHLLPRDWYTQVYNDRKEYMIYLLTGFKELCMNDDFFDALAERGFCNAILFYM